MKITKDALLLAQQRQSVKNRRHVEFNVGDHVYLSTRNIYSPVDKSRPTPKKIIAKVYRTL